MIFEDLREEMESPEFIVSCRAGSRKLLVTDASRNGLGAILIQNDRVGR
jgi:hypothetical protein